MKRDSGEEKPSDEREFTSRLRRLSGEEDDGDDDEEEEKRREHPPPPPLPPPRAVDAWTKGASVSGVPPTRAVVCTKAERVSVLVRNRAVKAVDVDNARSIVVSSKGLSMLLCT